MRNKLIAVLGALMLSAGAMQAQTGTATKAPMDINTASRTELASAGWGQYADAIIAGRPYKNMNDLVEKKVVPQKAYDKGYGNFTIGDGNSPMSDGNSAVTPPAVTPPTVTPGTAPTDGAGNDSHGNAGNHPDGNAGRSSDGDAGCRPDHDRTSSTEQVTSPSRAHASFHRVRPRRDGWTFREAPWQGS